jgi:hypothetical protein
MQTTDPITTTAASRSLSVADAATELVPLIDSVYVAGPPVLLAGAGTVLFALLLVGPFALFATLAVALAALALVVALAGAMLAAPFLLIGHVRRRVASRRRVPEGRPPVATAPARTGRAVERPAIAGLAGSMTARAAR